MNPSSSAVSGFSMVELLVVLSIAGILATIALPSFQSLTQVQQVKNASYELYTGLNLARSEAIKRSANVTLAATMNVANEVSWVITAVDGTVIHRPDFIKGVAMDVNDLAGTQVVYQRTGRTTEISAPTFQIDAAGEGTPTDFARCVKIELSGMPRIYKLPSGGTC